MNMCGSHGVAVLFVMGMIMWPPVKANAQGRQMPIVQEQAEKPAVGVRPENEALPPRPTRQERQELAARKRRVEAAWRRGLAAQPPGLQARIVDQFKETETDYPTRREGGKGDPLSPMGKVKLIVTVTIPEGRSHADAAIDAERNTAALLAAAGFEVVSDPKSNADRTVSVHLIYQYRNRRDCHLRGRIIFEGFGDIGCDAAGVYQGFDYGGGGAPAGRRGSVKFSTLPTFGSPGKALYWSDFYPTVTKVMAKAIGLERTVHAVLNVAWDNNERAYGPITLPTHFMVDAQMDVGRNAYGWPDILTGITALGRNAVPVLTEAMAHPHDERYYSYLELLLAAQGVDDVEPLIAPEDQSLIDAFVGSERTDAAVRKALEQLGDEAALLATALSDQRSASHALAKLTAPQQIARVAIENERLAYRATLRLNDQSLLARVAMETMNQDAAVAAMEKLTLQSALATIACEHENAYIRYLATEKLADPRDCVKAALWQDHKQVAKLTDQGLLESIALRAGTSLVRKVAVKTMADQQRLARVAMQSEHRVVCQLAIEKMTDPKLLAKIVEEKQDDFIRNEAAKRLQGISRD